MIHLYQYGRVSSPNRDVEKGKHGQGVGGWGTPLDLGRTLARPVGM